MGCPVVCWTHGSGAPEKDVGCNYRSGSQECASCQGLGEITKAKCVGREKLTTYDRALGETGIQ